MVVVACNTASAAAFEILKKKFGNKILLVDVINPMVDYIKINYNEKKIGIIATKGTVGSKVYDKKLKAKHITNVHSLATPLLVHLIEEGFSKHQGSQLLVHEYLNKKPLLKIDVLVLACTHYPILKSIIEDFYRRKVVVLDSTVITAEEVKKQLIKYNSLNLSKTKAKHQFFVSDFTPAFEQVTKIFYGEKINLKKNNIWMEG
jgi:glutamate racemase